MLPKAEPWRSNTWLIRDRDTVQVAVLRTAEQAQKRTPSTSQMENAIMQGKKAKISRRSFLKGAAAMTAATGTGWAQIVPRHVAGGKGHTPPSETVYVAGIGAGGMGGVDIQEAYRAGAKVVALCDVDDRRAAKTYRNLPDATKYKDFRRLLDKEKSIDAVIVGTPDHTHAVITMAAMERGKHVYCEKPLAHTLHEVRTVTEAARKYNVATQMGNQGHSFDAIRAFCECIWAGAIGDVREVHVVEGGHTNSHIDKLGRINEDHKIPKTLDWNLWLGPAPYRKYNPMYLPGSWRGWTQFGTGMMGDWMCHLVDPVFWALDLGAPSSVVAKAEGYDPKKHGETFPRSTFARFEFPAKDDRSPVTLFWYDGDKYEPPRPEEIKKGKEFIPVPPALWAMGRPFGAMVVGDKGKILYGSHGAAGWRIIPESKMKEYMEEHKKKYEPQLNDLPSGLKHHKDWLDACKDGKRAGSNFDYGGPLSEIAMLGNIALRMLGTELQWDAERMKFPNCTEANQYIHFPYREGWRL